MSLSRQKRATERRNLVNLQRKERKGRAWKISRLLQTSPGREKGDGPILLKKGKGGPAVPARPQKITKGPMFLWKKGGEKLKRAPQRDLPLR